MSRASEKAGSADAWVSIEERGSRILLHFLVWCVRRLGQAPLRLFVPPIAAYYCLFDPRARRASQEYLARVGSLRGDERTPSLRDTYRHLHCFAEGIADRLVLWSGAEEKFEIRVHGEECMREDVAAGRGVFLVGAHLGSFDVLRILARRSGIPVNTLAYVEHAELINEAFQMLDPDCRFRVIDLDPAMVQTGLEVRRCTDRGENVAILGDRVIPGARGRVAMTKFLGAEAPFSLGPFMLALLLRLPIVMAVALKTDSRSYDVHLELLSEGRAVSTRDRPEAARALVERYASRLEHYCLQAPLQWFNFYDFWAGGDDVSR